MKREKIESNILKKRKERKEVNLPIKLRKRKRKNLCKSGHTEVIL